MKIYNMVRDEKLQYDINRETEKISPFSSGNIDNYEYLTAEKILPTGQKKKAIKQATFTYFPLENL